LDVRILSADVGPEIIEEGDSAESEKGTVTRAFERARVPRKQHVALEYEATGDNKLSMKCNLQGWSTLVIAKAR
jgi:hypothetical protein